MNTFALILLLAMDTASSFAPMSTPVIQTSNCHVTPTVALQAANYYDDDKDEDLVKVPRRRERGRMFESEEEESEFYDRVEERVYGINVDDDEDEDDEDDEEWEDYDTFSNVVIDNPILDAIDPDGAYERFPELVRDPRFWLDMILFICFLNFLSDIGPQNTLPDSIWYFNQDNIDIVGVNALSLLL